MTVARKPASITYGVDEAPPQVVTVMNGLRHVGVIAINPVYPLLVFRVVGAPIELVASLLSTGMLEAALAPLLNRLRAIFPPEVSGHALLRNQWRRARRLQLGI